MSTITPALLAAILQHYSLPPGGTHGVTHWARVLENGRRLAAANGARLEVVELFAVLHDSQRQNEGFDHGHGARGAELAARLRGPAFDLDDAGFELLLFACRLHTDGQTQADVSVQTCWDADRLDLPRVGILVTDEFLCTPAAHDPELVAWARQRAERRHLPPLVENDWGIPPQDLSTASG
jgi:uncharacterized protein